MVIQPQKASRSGKRVWVCYDNLDVESLLLLLIHRCACSDRGGCIAWSGNKVSYIHGHDLGDFLSWRFICIVSKPHWSHCSSIHLLTRSPSICNHRANLWLAKLAQLSTFHIQQCFSTFFEPRHTIIFEKISRNTTRSLPGTIALLDIFFLTAHTAHNGDGFIASLLSSEKKKYKRSFYIAPQKSISIN